MSRRENTTMQSEIFIVLMIVMILLFIITSLYLAKLKEHQQPPLIVLDEAHGYSFKSSSASLNATFQSQLASVVEKIKRFSKEHKCDIVEVYGYTDAQPFSGASRGASFDRDLHACLIEGCDIDQIPASSNLELGMKRAVSVVEFLKPYLLGKSNIKIIRPYSAGQFIDETGNIASMQRGSNKERRRIEIRLSRSRDFLKR